jgi:hypothetical protein
LATFAELSLKNRLFMKSYPFSRYRIGDQPRASLSRPLNRCRVALITTAGLNPPDQDRFESNAMGDCSFREIVNDIDLHSLIESHKSNAFDHSGISIDRNLALPLDRFRELVARGEIGELNHRHFSFMGSIIKPHRLIAETAPQVAEKLRQDGVMAAFLTPA